ncbi:MAG TPA: outer membrane protein assembly factor BamC [Methylophilaceae bacterium]|nr:outer membrane protein assembly factor BamC [Methylophilaceae bacterium]
MNHIPFFNVRTIAIASLLAMTLSACSSLPFVDTTPDYKAAGRSRPLEVPPDLTSISSSDTYAVPGGSTTYSSYSQGKEEPGQEQDKVLPNPDNVRLERAGSQRWLVVQASPEKIWPVIRDFWSELGFAVRVENPQTGVMETEWVDPSSLTKDDKASSLDKFQGWLDKLNTLKTRQKFRTRIDQGTEADTTEIYMSHRSISDVEDDGKVRVRTIAGDIENGYAPRSRSKNDDARADAEDIDAELLRRLMVRLGVEEQKSRAIVASGSNELRATVNKDSNGTLSLSVNDQFDRAWRRVGLALDRVGFVVEDKDRSSGIYYVRYTDTDIDSDPKKKKGLLDSLKFWGDDDKVAQPEPKKENTGMVDKLKFWKATDKEGKVDPDKQYRVKIEENSDANSQITITDKDGNLNRSNTANRIISLLYEQLK